MKTNSNANFIGKLFQIEKQLFDLKSKEGVYYWDIFRHSVSGVVLYRLTRENQIQTSKQSFSTIVHKLIKVLRQSFCVFKNYENIVFAASRNRDKSRFIDQQVYGILPYLSHDKTLIVETYDNKARGSYSDFDYISSFGIYRKLLKPHYEKIDFSSLASRLNEYFETDYFDHTYFASLYHNFWKDYVFYKFIFKHMHIKRVYMSQNGIQKGLFKAAGEMNVDVYEFQHGLIDKTHMAYSYPHIANLEKKTYLPTYLLKLSDFWLYDCYMPHTKQITLGNDYFVPKIGKDVNPDTHKILVISSSVHGSYLYDFINECFKCNPEYLGYTFIFKLHPAEYGHINNYKEMFCGIPNVSVVTNEKTVSQWMTECATMLLIQSTSAYEALQCGRKVAILKKLSWEVMEPIFKEENTHLIDTPEEFMKVLNIEADSAKPLYFQLLNHQILGTIINN